MHSPSSRNFSPVTIYDASTGTLLSYPHTVSLTRHGAMLVYDFGMEVGGIVSLRYSADGEGKLGLAFSETKDYIGPDSDGSNGSYHPGGDGALWTLIGETKNGLYCMPDAKLRGGFRYLTLFTKTDIEINVEITSVTLELSFQPNWTDLQAYGGYFYCDDDLLNRIWYAGAYTLQTNVIPSRTGRVYPLLHYGWDNSAHLGTPGPCIFVDGSKRDRATWSGDLLMALPSAFVSTGDFESAKHALQLCYDLQVCTCRELARECLIVPETFRRTANGWTAAQLLWIRYLPHVGIDWNVRLRSIQWSHGILEHELDKDCFRDLVYRQ